jgi:glycosyltransferase involved in cell wall biosynthesis
MNIVISHEQGATRARKPLISVILCTYNAVNFVKEAIDSILNQSLDDFELIIVDDGSSDGTKDIIQKYSDYRIRYFPMKVNSGLIFSRNFAISKSNGDYIALMDHDDISEPNRLEAQIEHIKLTNSDVCSSFHYELNNSTKIIKKRKSYTRNSDIRALLTVYSPITNPSVLLRKNIFNYHSYSKESEMAEDYALWCELAKKEKKFTCCPEFLITYRVHPTQMSIAGIKNNKTVSELIKASYIHDLLGVGYQTPAKEFFFNRLKIAIPFLKRINQIIPRISIFANYEIYARYQFRGNGVLTPLIRFERLIMAVIMSFYGWYASKKSNP